MTVHTFKDTLPSGLRVVTVEAPHLHSANICAYVRVGSRHETPENNGVSHFLEHLFFRGSAGYSDTVRMNAAVEDAGGNLNGVTTRDHGCYFTPLHPEHLAVGTRIMGDMLTRPLLTHLDVEREIILEEMLDEVDEKGRDIDIDNLAKREIYGRHPLGLKIAGTRDSVRGLTLEQIRAHLARYYVAENMVFAASGRVRRDEVLALAESAFGRLARGRPNTDTPPPSWPRGPWFKFIRHEEAQTELRLTFPAVPEHHPDYPAFILIRRVLDDGLSSRLPFHVVEQRGLAYSIHATLEAFDDVGTFDVDAATAPEKVSRVFEAVCEVLAELREKPVPEEELKRAQKRHRMHVELLQDSSPDLAGWFGGAELFRPAESFEERCRRVDAQTAERVREVANRYLAAPKLGVLAVGQRRGIRALERSVAHARRLL